MKKKSITFRDYLLNGDHNSFVSMFWSQEVKELRRSFRRGKLRDCESRIQQLRQLNKLIEENKEALFDALYKDLRKVTKWQVSNISDVYMLLIFTSLWGNRLEYI